MQDIMSKEIYYKEGKQRTLINFLVLLAKFLFNFLYSQFLNFLCMF